MPNKMYRARTRWAKHIKPKAIEGVIDVCGGPGAERFRDEETGKFYWMAYADGTSAGPHETQAAALASGFASLRANGWRESRTEAEADLKTKLAERRAR